MLTLPYTVELNSYINIKNKYYKKKQKKIQRGNARIGGQPCWHQTLPELPEEKNGEGTAAGW